MKMLEIGPGKTRIPGFETLDIFPGPNVDHVGDARRLPFKNGAYDLVYASHVIEHVPWFQLEETLKEWRRVIKTGGVLEVWTVDALKIMKEIISFEESGVWNGPRLSVWFPEAVKGDPYKFLNGRVFNRPKGKNESEWHRGLFTPRHLLNCLNGAGFSSVQLLDRAQVRGYDHGWINLGASGIA
jgi:SAM-dependent methyltransferase